MSNNQTTTRWRHPSWVYVTFILACIIGAAALVVFVSTKFTTVPSLQVENWVSYLVSLIGICATIMVGTQVLNFIEIRKMVSEADVKMKELEKLQDKLRKTADASEKNNLEMKNKSNDIANSFYIISETFANDEPLNKAICLIYSLTSLVYPYEKADVLLNRLGKIQSNLKKIENISISWKETLIAQFEKLENIDVPDNCPKNKRMDVIAAKGEVLSMLKKLADNQNMTD